MWRALILGLLVLPAIGAEPVIQADDGSDQLFGFSRSVATLVGVGAALVLLGVLFMVRRFLGVIMNIVFLLLGTALVIVALFGNQIGIYDAIDEIIKSGKQAPGP